MCIVSSKVFIVRFDPFFEKDSKSKEADKVHHYHWINMTQLRFDPCFEKDSVSEEPENIHHWNNMTQLTFPFAILSSDASKVSDVSKECMTLTKIKVIL